MMGLEVAELEALINASAIRNTEITHLKSVVAIQKEHTAEIEKQRKLVADSEKTYKTITASFRELYDATPAGQLEKLVATREEKLQELQRLKYGRLEEYYIPGVGNKTRLIPADPNDIRIAEAAIASLTSKIRDLQKESKNTTLPDWIKILQSNTGFSLGQMEGMWAGVSGNGKSLPVIQQFEEMMKLRGGAQRFLAGQTGGGITDMLAGEVSLWENMVSDMMTIHQEKLEDGTVVWKRVWEENEAAFATALKNMKAAKAEHFDSMINDINARASIYQDSTLTGFDKRKTLYGLENNYSGGDLDRAWEAKNNEETAKLFSELEAELKLRKEMIWLSEEERRVKELTAQIGDEAKAKEIAALETEIEKTKALTDAMDQLKEAGLQLAAGGLVDFAHDLGKAFQDGSISSDELDGAIRNMVKSLIDAMPQLLLNIGLQLLPKNWKLGLAFIGA